MLDCLTIQIIGKNITTSICEVSKLLLNIPLCAAVPKMQTINPQVSR
jgi:hypothetical protein